jgi:hypothetical protein
LLIDILILKYNFLLPSFNGLIIRVVDHDILIFQAEDGSFPVRMFGIAAYERDRTYSKEFGEFLSKYLHNHDISKVTGTGRYCTRLGIFKYHTKIFSMAL